MGLANNLRSIRAGFGQILQCQVTQKFDISLRAFYRREGQAKNSELQLVGQCHKLIENLLVSPGIPNNALLTHLIL